MPICCECSQPDCCRIKMTDVRLAKLDGEAYVAHCAHTNVGDKRGRSNAGSMGVSQREKKLEKVELRDKFVGATP